MDADPWHDQEAVLWLIVDGMRRAGGEPVVFQYVAHARVLYDDRPDRCLAEISADYVSYRKPVAGSRKIRPRALAFERVDPGSDEIHRGFVPALRQLVDFFVRHKPDSPDRAERIVARADELAFASQLDRTQLRIVGHLLDVEDIGKIEWTEDPSNPWTVEVGFQILRYRRVATFGDFVDVKFDHVHD